MYINLYIYQRLTQKLLTLAGAFVFSIPLLTGCSSNGTPFKANSLNAARASFKSSFAANLGDRYPLDRAPEAIFKNVTYPAEVGELAAYLTPDPGDGQKHPAIIWITGGDYNSISDVWSPAPRNNDQTAAAFRQAGIVMMFPSMRGGNNNPGNREGFLGEVDDVLAAAKFLAQQPYVDPKRIYLGGHSTGGTMALIIAESSDRFRAIFSFGPIDDVAYYGENNWLPIDLNDPKEVTVRSPLYWLDNIKSPTFVLEGSGGNVESLQAMEARNQNPQVSFIEGQGSDHFSILAPVNELLAQKILQDKEGNSSQIHLSEVEVNAAIKR